MLATAQPAPPVKAVDEGLAMPDHDSTDYLWGETTSELRSVRKDLDKLEQQVNTRFVEIYKDLELLRRICYALAGAVAFVNLLGPLMKIFEG